LAVPVGERIRKGAESPLVGDLDF